jgi:hypothetical protein
MNLTRLSAALALLFCLTSAQAQNETPTINPSAVVIKGRVVSHSWRDGRIWVPTSDLQPLLNMGSEYPSMDLLKALEQKGGYLWSMVDGRFEARPDPANYSQAADAGPSSAQNRGGADYRVAEQRMKEAFQKYPRLDSHPDLPRVERIGQQIVAVSDMPTLNWNFFIVRGQDPNAFCCGAGWVAVTDGLLALKLSDNELAGILAHEVGHGCCKDLEEGKFNREQMARYGDEAQRLDQERQTLLRRQQQLLAKAQNALDLSELATSSGQALSYRSEAQNLYSQARALDRPIKKLDKAVATNVKGYQNKEAVLTDDVLQKKDEYDADIKGIYYATKAGFSPTGLMDSLKKITRTEAEKFGQAAYQGGFSHPPVAERIKTMNKVLKDWRDQR